MINTLLWNQWRYCKFYIIPTIKISMISVVILILLTPSIEGVSSFRYSDGRQNPATHFPTCCPFTNPPSYSCSLEIVILEINKMMTYIKLLFFLILNCKHYQSLFYSIRESIYISSFWYYYMILLRGMW